jgi:phage shock protein E
MSLIARILSKGSTSKDASLESPVELHPAEFLQIRTPDAVVLDVRTAAEFASEHLEVARNVDILQDGFIERVEELGVDREQPVYLYCRSGNRSGHAARLLRQRGYRAFNVGGLNDLVREGAGLAED